MRSIHHLFLLLGGLLAFMPHCTAGVAHSVQVILPTPHVNVQTGAARQIGNLFFYTDRNIPETSNAYNALLQGKTAETLDILSQIEGSNLPDIQQAYWQNDVAVCFILDGRYKEADELLMQASLLADEEAIMHNKRIAVYLHESWRTLKERKKVEVAPPSKQP
ncbi:MAG TPA: hypothetical protein PLY93_12785 [Turneriella sp.]|nr:hypothetical protein [Turneriella sp.]